jgi:hypothetical protein
MFNPQLTLAIENLSAIMLPLSEKDLEREWKWKDHDEEGIRFAFFVTIQELRQLAVQLGANRKSLSQTQRILGQYHAQYLDLQAAILGLSAHDADLLPAEGEWSARRVYSHILGTDIGFSAVVRFTLEGRRAGIWKPQQMTEEDETRLTGMNEEQYKLLTRGPLEPMLAFHRDSHPKLIQEFSSITDQELDLPAVFWEETHFPIRHRLHRFEAHSVQHTVQIDKTLVAIGQAPGETKRLIRYLFAALASVDAYLIGENEYQESCVKLAESITSRTEEIRSILET